MDVEKLKEMEANTDFVVSWFAKKYNKTIFRVGNLNKERSDDVSAICHRFAHDSPDPEKSPVDRRQFFWKSSALKDTRKNSTKQDN